MGTCLARMYGCFCCQCNCIVFPAPSPSYSKQNLDKCLQFFTNQSGYRVPYLYLPYKNSRRNIIFFHGNAEDIGYSSQFLEPIAEQLKASVYAIEYPSYGLYTVNYPCQISNGIKSDSIQFYEYLQRSKQKSVNRNNTIIMGRSIGSGGATYLASQMKMQNLILVSPFSTIPNIATDFVGCSCATCFIKCHFNNLEELERYNGRLLVIHGLADQVINVRHGKMLVDQYIRKNPQYCKFSYPKRMSHNSFDYDRDILTPIVQFVNQSESTESMIK